MSYRDTATALAQRAPGNFIGVVLYVQAPFWSAHAFPNAAALEEWYEEIAPSHPLFYYIAAFDKTQGMEPAGESIAPIRFGMPGFDMRITDKWRYHPYKRPRPTISGVPDDAFADRLRFLPGFVGAGRVLQNPQALPREWFEIYEVRWLRGQPVPSLPSTIDGRAVRLVLVDEYPRAQATISGEDRGPGGIAKTVAIFALLAIPVGIILTKTQEKKQLRDEKAAFRRIGIDWDKRVSS